MCHNHAGGEIDVSANEQDLPFPDDAIRLEGAPERPTRPAHGGRFARRLVMLFVAFCQRHPTSLDVQASRQPAPLSGPAGVFGFARGKRHHWGTGVVYVQSNIWHSAQVAISGEVCVDIQAQWQIDVTMGLAGWPSDVLLPHGFAIGIDLGGTNSEAGVAR